jgi:beta-lactamase superfamily II metal-dependent hydrolase
MSRTLPSGLYLLLFVGLVVGNISVYRAIFAPSVLQVTVLEVGKGDATLVRSPSGATLLIDVGPDASILRALGTALPPWQRKIDIVILTNNTKKSSIGGLPDVLSRYKVAQQITITESKRLTFGEGSSIDILVSPNATTTVVAK